MARRYSFAAGKVIDVPDRKADDDMDTKQRLAKLENGERVQELELEVTTLRASIRQLMREADETNAECERLKTENTELRNARAADAAKPAVAPVVNVPAPIVKVDVPAPIVNLPAAASSGFVVEVTGRDGHGRLARLSITPKG